MTSHTLTLPLLRSGSLPLPRCGRGAVLACALLLSGAAQAADPSPAMQAVLTELNMPAAILDGVDSELAVPPDWIEAAKREQKLRLYGTWEPKEQERVLKPFRARYPFLDVTYARATRQDRSLRPLVALKEGRVLVDVISGLGNQIGAYRDLGAFLPLGDLPGFANTPAELKAPDGLWVGHQLNYWCTAYNVARVKPEQMPAQWEGFLEPARWGDARIGLGNRPNLWLLPLMDLKGRDWTQRYAAELFGTLRPQLRKEGMNALLNLVGIGEFDVAIPVAQYRLHGDYGRQASIAWHCPDPVPTTVQVVGIMKQSPNAHAARLYVNWLLSREGQLAQYEAVAAAPSHPALQGPQFLGFAAQVAGKGRAFRSPELLEQGQWTELLTAWNRLWESGGKAR